MIRILGLLLIAGGGYLAWQNKDAIMARVKEIAPDLPGGNGGDPTNDDPGAISTRPLIDQGTAIDPTQPPAQPLNDHVPGSPVEITDPNFVQNFNNCVAWHRGDYMACIPPTVRRSARALKEYQLLAEKKGVKF